MAKRRAAIKNVEMKVDGNILTIRGDLSKEFGPSSSGKTIIGSSGSIPIERSRLVDPVSKDENETASRCGSPGPSEIMKRNDLSFEKISPRGLIRLSWAIKPLAWVAFNWCNTSGIP